jgi:HTH-type transcriptional regulator, competence development regulator
MLMHQPQPFGTVLRQAREVRGLSGIDAARMTGISAAYLSKLENDAVRKPSPPVLHQLSEALTVPYAELMRMAGYHVPGATDKNHSRSGALRRPLGRRAGELIEYLAWYRGRRRSTRRVGSAG